MPKEHVKAVHRFYDAYNRRDREAVAALFHPEIEWHTLAGPILGVETIQRRDEVLDFIFELIPDGISDFQIFVDGVSELPGGQVLVVGHYTGRGVASRAEVEMRTAAIYSFDAGRIVLFQEFATREEALEAAGLSE